MGQLQCIDKDNKIEKKKLERLKKNINLQGGQNSKMACQKVHENTKIRNDEFIFNKIVELQYKGQ